MYVRTSMILQIWEQQEEFELAAGDTAEARHLTAREAATAMQTDLKVLIPKCRYPQIEFLYICMCLYIYVDVYKYVVRICMCLNTAQHTFAWRRLRFWMKTTSDCCQCIHNRPR